MTLQRSPLKRRSWWNPKRSKPLARQSTKRQGERAARGDVIEAVLLRDGRGCSARLVLPHECAGPLDAHEVIPRSAWPGGHLVASNVRLLCRKAHDWVGDHPDAAHKLGLHGYSWERPS